MEAFYWFAVGAVAFNVAMALWMIATNREAWA